MSIWSGLKGLLTGGADKGIERILGAIDELHTSGEEKAVLRRSVLEVMIEAQASGIVAEYQHGNLLSRSWRPLLMLAFGSIIIYTFWVAPMFDLKVVDVDVHKLPDRMWRLLEIGIGGYIGGRSLEKITAMIAPGRKLKKLLNEMRRES